MSQIYIYCPHCKAKIKVDREKFYASLKKKIECPACRKSMTLSQDLFAGSRETPKQAKEKLVTAASVMFFGGVLLLALYVNLLRPEASDLDFVGKFILLPIPVLGMVLGLYLFLSSFKKECKEYQDTAKARSSAAGVTAITKKIKFEDLAFLTILFLFLGGITGMLLTWFFVPEKPSLTYLTVQLVFCGMPFLGLVLGLCLWVYICCKEFWHKGESKSFEEGLGVLFFMVAVPAVGFVVWYFVNGMQENWRDTAELKKATVELLEETKKQNRAVGIK